MSEASPLVEAIRVLPPTITALGALLYARRATSEASAANRAVNHVDPSEPRLVEKVDRLVERLEEVAGRVERLERRSVKDAEIDTLAQQGRIERRKS